MTMIVNASSGPNPCNCEITDKTPPRQLTILQSLASSAILPNNTHYEAGGSTGPATNASRDPAYIEVSNWEPGCKFQMHVTSDVPGPLFSENATVLEFKPTGVDPISGVASLYIPQSDMDRLGIQAGDEYWLRQVDFQGNASVATRGRLVGASAGNALEGGRWVAASQLSVLDGNARRSVLFRGIRDSTPPKIDRFVQELALVATGGNVELVSSQALEGEARVRVLNTATGTALDGRVDPNTRELRINLHNLSDGTPLIVMVSDNSGNQAQPIGLRYGSKCMRGVVPDNFLADVPAAVIPQQS